MIEGYYHVNWINYWDPYIILATKEDSQNRSSCGKKGPTCDGRIMIFHNVVYQEFEDFSLPDYSNNSEIGLVQEIFYQSDLVTHLKPIYVLL